MANKHSCKKYDLMIDDYIDDLLSDDERRKLEEHLSVCENCRSSLRFSLMLKEMAPASIKKAPDDLHERIMNSVGSEIKEQKLVSRRRILRLGAISAACMLFCICCTIVLLMLPGRQKSDTNIPKDDPIYNSPADTFEFEQDKSEILTSSAAIDTNPLEEEITPDNDSPIVSTSSPEKDEAIDTENAAEEAPIIPAETTSKPSTEQIESLSPEAETDKTPTTSLVANGAQTSALNSSSEKSSRPGGNEITFALLIVSGLLAVASFIAFLISLSSVRTHSSNKENGKK